MVSISSSIVELFSKQEAFPETYGADSVQEIQAAISLSSFLDL